MTKQKPIGGKVVNRSFGATRGLGRPSPAQAAELAGEALGFIAADPETLADFLALTGLTPGTLRAATASDGFARGILSYLAADETLLVRFAQDRGRDPAALAATVAAITQEADDV